MPFPIIRKIVQLLAENQQKVSRREQEEKHLSQFFSQTTPNSRYVPLDLIKIITEYGDKETPTIPLTDKDIAKLILIEFGHLLEEKSNPTLTKFTMGGMTPLPKGVTALREEMKLSNENNRCPTFTDNFDTNQSILGTFATDLAKIGGLPASNQIKQNLYLSQMYKEPLTSLDLKMPDNIKLPKEFDDDTPDIIYHTPPQLVLLLEIAKDHYYQEMEKKGFDKGSLGNFLIVVRNLENVKRLYRAMSYLDCFTFKHVTITYAMSIAIYKNISPEGVRNTQGDVLRGLQGIPCIARALVASKIRFLDIDFNGGDGYNIIIGEESLPTLLAIPGVAQHYTPKLYYDDSLTAKDFLNLVSAKISEQTGTTKQAKLNVAIEWVTKLQYVSEDSKGTQFALIKQTLLNDKHQITIFLQTRLKKPILSALFKSTTDSYDLVASFSGVRQAELAKAHQALQTQMPTLYGIEYENAALPASSDSSSSSNSSSSSSSSSTYSSLG